MAALAIDVVTLYVAKSEAQRAADAAAIAGATAFVNSGATSAAPSDPLNTSLAPTMANSFIAASLAQNNVSGSPPTLLSSTFDSTTYPGNPHVTVTVQQANLPTFFSRIWGKTSASVQATATAEAYNSSAAQAGSAGGTYIPPAPKCVKPMLVANLDPTHTTPTNPQFVSMIDGSVTATYNTSYNPGLPNKGGFIGEPISLTSGCKTITNGSCTPGGVKMAAGTYLPEAVPAGSTTSGSNGSYNSTVCPGDCSNLGGTPYQQSIACCDTTTYNFTQCSASTNTYAYYDSSNNPDYPPQTNNGLQCVIHTSTAGYAPDTLTLPATFPNDPFQIQPGTYTQTALGVGATTYLSTSDSIITVPLINPNLTGSNQVTVVGFLQIFVNATNAPPNTPDLSGVVLNVIGCGNAATAGAISGGGVSPVPVRLITPP